MPSYLDYNATTPVDERVLEVMLPYMAAPHGNPSSVHRYGRYSRAAIDRAREQVALLVNAQPAEVLFTASGTEANNLAIKGVMNSFGSGALAVSGIEHHAVLEPAEFIERFGFETLVLPADNNGRVSPGSISALTAEKLRLVSVMWANSETGAIQDVVALAEAAHAKGALFHSDAVQAVGKLAVDFEASGADLISLSAHKIYGPKGAGALIRRNAVDLQPQLHGGGQERGARAGTENVAAIVGFGMAAELAAIELQSRAEHCLALQVDLEKKLAAFPEITVFSKGVSRLSNTTQIGVPGFDAETLLMELDRSGVAVSAGSACSSGTGEPSHVLTAMGIPFEVAQGAVRISFGKDSQAKDVDAFMLALTDVLKRFGKTV